MSSLHAHELAQRCTSGWTDRIGFAVPGKPPSVRYGQDEFMSSLYTLDAPLTSLRTRVRARRASGASVRKTRFTDIRGLITGTRGCMHTQVLSRCGCSWSGCGGEDSKQGARSRSIKLKDCADRNGASLRGSAQISCSPIIVNSCLRRPTPRGQNRRAARRSVMLD